MYLGAKQVLIGLIALLGASASASQGPYGAPPKLSKCGKYLLAKRDQEQLEEQRAANKRNNFIVTRGIKTYDATFDHQFLSRIREISQKQHVTLFDWGAGTARTLREIAEIAQKENWPYPPRLVAISDTLPSKGDKSQIEFHERDKLNVVNKERAHKEIEAMEQAIENKIIDYKVADGNKPLDFNERATLAADKYGVLSYAEDLSQTLENTFKHLEENGELFIYTDFNETQIYLNGRNGGSISLDAFLSQVPGLKVEVIKEAKTLKVTKTQSNIEFPQLRLIYWRLGTPPTRRYEVILDN
ncbi:MAG: hypothetical protein R3A80_07795 [Bdellovibrionota bacterium]